MVASIHPPQNLRRWYWKNGHPAVPDDVEAGSDEWLKHMKRVEERLKDEEYKTIGDDTTWWGARVSTVWLGLDHSFKLDGDKLIFETMVFWPSSSLSRGLYLSRYSTLQQARDGHERVLEEFKNPLVLLEYFWHRLRGNLQ